MSDLSSDEGDLGFESTPEPETDDTYGLDDQFWRECAKALEDADFLIAKTEQWCASAAEEQQARIETNTRNCAELQKTSARLVKKMDAVEAAWGALGDIIETRQETTNTALQIYEQETKELYISQQEALKIVDNITQLLEKHLEEALEFHRAAELSYIEVSVNIEKAREKYEKARIELEQAIENVRKAQAVYQQALAAYNAAMQAYARGRKRAGMIKSLVGIAVGAFAAWICPALAPNIFAAFGTGAGALVAEGMVFGTVSTAVSGGNIIEGMISGGVFAGAASIAKVGALNMATTITQHAGTIRATVRAVQAATVATISTAIHGGKLLPNVLLSVGANAAANGMVRLGNNSDVLRRVLNGAAEGASAAILTGQKEKALLSAGMSAAQVGARCLGENCGYRVAPISVDRAQIGKNSRVVLPDDASVTAVQKERMAGELAARRVAQQRQAKAKTYIFQTEDGQAVQVSEKQLKQYYKALPKEHPISKTIALVLGIGSVQAVDDRSLVYKKEKPSVADAWASRYIGGQFSESVLFMSPEELRQHGVEFAKRFPGMSDRRREVDFALFLKSPAAAQGKGPSCLEYMSKLTAGVGIGAISNTVVGSVAKTFPVSSAVLSFFASVLYLENATVKLYKSAPTLDPEFMELMRNPLLSDSVKERLWQGAAMREHMFAEGTYEPFGKCISRFIREKPFETGIIIGSVEQLLRKPVGRSIAWTYHSINKRGFVVEVPASTISFSQGTVNDVLELQSSMKKHGWKMFAEPIDVVRMPNGNLAVIDNTRAKVAKDLGMEVKVIIRDFDSPVLEQYIQAKRFIKYGNPKTWGEVIQCRIHDQGKLFRETYPNGAPDVRIGTRP